MSRNLTPLQSAAVGKQKANALGKNISELQNFLKDYKSTMPAADIARAEKAIENARTGYKAMRKMETFGKKLSQFRHQTIIERRVSGIPASRQVGIDLLGRLTNVDKIANVSKSANGLTITSDFEGLSARLQKKVEEVQDIFLVNCLESIKAKTPVDTGRARDGWYIAGKQILNDVPYVPYLEMGTEKMRPFAMVAATVANKEDLLARAVAEAGDL
jgi:hypothetical protein